MKNFIYLLCSIFLMATISASAQVYISEYSASNMNQFPDNYLKYEDWIELHNDSNSSVDISGWGLSDKQTNLLKWTFPEGTVMQPNSYLVVWCSGRDESDPDQLIFHTNYKLTQTKDNEFVVLSDETGFALESSILEITLLGHSRFRQGPDEEWKINTDPSVAFGPNMADSYNAYTQEPVISLEAGIYEGAQIVTIETDEEDITLRYSLNGDAPTTSSPVYSGPITVDETMIVKAQNFPNKPDMLPGKIAFATYFIDDSFTLPVFSIGADQLQELANGAGEIRPIGSIEYFTADGKLEAVSYGELNRHGQDSWALDHRSIDWVSRDEMGYNKAVDAKLFNYSERTEFQRFMMRASGDDNYPAINDGAHEGSAHVRDEYVHTLAQNGGMHMDLRALERVIVFLNGDYWGVYGLRERPADHDFTKYTYDQGKFDLHYLATWGNTWAEYGGQDAFDDWGDFRDFILNNDMGDPQNYQYVTDNMDVISLMDYMIINLACVSSDWMNYNTGWWRGLDEDGGHQKWGYILWDNDATFDYYINYSGVPNTDPDAQPCDISRIGNAMDNFFDNPSELPAEDPNDCLSIINGSCPYPADDPAFIGTILQDGFCCTGYWDGICQNLYDNYTGGGTGTGGAEDCQTILDGSSPYPADDWAFQIVIGQDGFCCDNDWDNICQDQYDDIIANNPGPFDPNDCITIINGTSPYEATDSIFLLVVEEDMSCCEVAWDEDCQALYDAFLIGPPDPADCPTIVNGTCPYDSEDEIFLQVIDYDSDCCDLDWDETCEDLYSLFEDRLPDDINECESIANGSSPYGSDDWIFANVVRQAPSCCQIEWDAYCQDIYDDIEQESQNVGDVGKHEKIFLKLQLENPEFAQLYYSRQADLMNTVFSCENMLNTLDSLIAIIEPEMPRQINRWGGTMSEWTNNVEDLRDFITERCTLIDDGLMDCFALEGPYPFTLIVEPEGAGQIGINTLTVNNFPYNANYFGNMITELTALPNNNSEGTGTFLNWESNNGSISSDNMSDISTSFELTQADTIIAYFDWEANIDTMDIDTMDIDTMDIDTMDIDTMDIDTMDIDTMDTGLSLQDQAAYLNIYPSPASDYVMVDYSIPGDVPVRLALYSTNGELIKVISTNMEVRPDTPYSTRIDLNELNLSSGMYYINMYYRDQKAGKRLIIMRE